MIQMFASTHHRFYYFHAHNAYIGKFREMLRHPLRLFRCFVLLLIATPAGGVAFAVKLCFDAVTHFHRSTGGQRVNKWVSLDHAHRQSPSSSILHFGALLMMAVVLRCKSRSV